MLKKKVAWIRVSECLHIFLTFAAVVRFLTALELGVIVRPNSLPWMTTTLFAMPCFLISAQKDLTAELTAGSLDGWTDGKQY